jgi:Ca-activated chloride channel family protein
MSRATIKLTGKVGSRTETFSFAGHSFASEEKDHQFLPRLWATRRVGYLLEQIRLNGENRELVDEIVGLGTRFGIVTPYTSFLVTEDMKDLARGGRNSEQLQRRYKAMQPADAAGSNAPASGEMAVLRSREERKIKEADAADGFADSLSSVRMVGSKTFILKDAVWIDTEYKAEARLPKVEAAFGSEEFFKLVSDKPALAEFFALGKKVIVVLEGKVYQSS